MSELKFYCQRLCGEVDFDIREWNKAQEEIKTLTPEQQSFVNQAIPDCHEQCKVCKNIVAATRLKNSGQYPSQPQPTTTTTENQ